MTGNGGAERVVPTGISDGFLLTVASVLTDHPQTSEEIATAIHLGPQRHAYRLRNIDLALEDLFKSGRAAKWWPSMRDRASGMKPRWTK
jgi:hypothetical protein